jgi:Holliday junction resolvase
MKQQSKLIKYWKEQGFFVINLIAITPIGLPDLLCLKPDKVIFCESKEKADKLSPLQKIWIERLKKLGFEVYLNQDLIK